MKTPKKRDQKTTKEKLLKAALDIFSKEGYDAATTRNIAKKAGVNESLIHRYFETKAGLFIALKQEFRESVISDFLESYDESETIQEELTNFLKFRLARTRKHKKFFKLSVARVMVDSKLKEDVKSYSRMKPAALFERFEGFRKKGQIRKDVVLDDFINVLHTVAFGIGILSQAVECLEVDEADRLIETTAELLTQGLVPRK
jgi:TetR/AcrR family transcriptional regulator, regulator of cefoperazone and chloramphenicol sensitivity